MISYGKSFELEIEMEADHETDAEEKFKDIEDAFNRLDKPIKFNDFMHILSSEVTDCGNVEEI